MHHLLNVCGIATAAIALAATAPSAAAQGNTFTLACQSIGSGALEPLGDREGHSLLVGEYSCRADSGPLSGGVWTATDIWEFNGTNAVLVTGYGVIRKPGATAVYQDTEGRLALTMTDGKVTGLTISGRGHWPLATGGSASLTGKSYTFAAKSAGPGRFAVEIKY